MESTAERLTLNDWLLLMIRRHGGDWMNSDSHAATLTTSEGEKGRFLPGEGLLGVEQMKPAHASWAVLEPWLGKTLSVLRTPLVVASSTEERLWGKGGKIWVKAHYWVKSMLLIATLSFKKKKNLVTQHTGQKMTKWRHLLNQWQNPWTLE